MSNHNQIIDYTKLFQDVELATGAGQLKQNPAQLQQFLQGQQDKIYEDVIKQKDSTFQKAYGDLNLASQAHDAILLLDKRNQELAEIQTQIYNKQEKSANIVTDNKNLSGRKYEMNQWSVSNKNDTLFVFSSLFILLSILILLTALWHMRLISGSLCGSLAAPLIIIFILIIIYRANFTNIWRNNRYWNRRTFEGKYGKIPIPLCPNINDLSQEKNVLLNDITKNLNLVSLESDIKKDINNAELSVAQDIVKNVKDNNITQ